MWLSEMESGYFLRQQNIKRICQIYGEKLERKETSFAKNFMIDTNHRLAYCRHGKVTLSNACEIILNFYAIVSHYYLNKVSQFVSMRANFHYLWQSPYVHSLYYITFSDLLMINVLVLICTNMIIYSYR